MSPHRCTRRLVFLGCAVLVISSGATACSSNQVTGMSASSTGTAGLSTTSAESQPVNVHSFPYATSPPRVSPASVTEPSQLTGSAAANLCTTVIGKSVGFAFDSSQGSPDFGPFRANNGHTYPKNSVFIAGKQSTHGNLCWTSDDPSAPVLIALPAGPEPIPYLSVGIPEYFDPWGAVGPGVDTVKVVFKGPGQPETLYFSRLKSTSRLSKLANQTMDDLGNGWATFHESMLAIDSHDSPPPAYSATATAYDPQGAVLGTRTVSYP